MILRDYLIEQLAEMVVGDNPAFPYRSSSRITKFFNRCGFPFQHDGSTRRLWAADRLKELNQNVCLSADLPSKDIVAIISELFEIDDFERGQLDPQSALTELNRAVSKQSLIAYLDESGRCHLRNSGTGVNSASNGQKPRPLSAEEVTQRNTLSKFLDSASEDEFTEQVLVPLFQRLGFHRVSVAGHTEKILEYGKDLWMKYQLPTSHWLYFGVQVKRDKLDAKGSGGDSNTATVLSQVRMAIDHPVFDPETNRKVLIDHVFVISAGEITRAARNWLVEKLDISQRRQIIFMDRDEFLDQSARVLLDLNVSSKASGQWTEESPF